MKSKDIVSTVFGVALKIIVAVIVIMLVYKYSLLAYDFGYRLFGELPITTGEGRTVSVMVPAGSSAKEVGEILENKGLIRDSSLFVVQEKLSNHRGEIQAGTFELNTSMTAEEMITVMATGAPFNEKEDDENKSLDEIKEELGSQQEERETTVVGSKGETEE